MAGTTSSNQGAREVYGAIGISTPNGDSAMDDTNDAVRVNIVAGAGSGGTSATDDAAFTPAVGTGTPIMGFADETGPDSVDEGDVGVLRMTLTRALHVNLRDASGSEVSVGGGTQYDEDTASSAGDKLTMAGVVRKDTAATLVGTDGDRTQMQVDANGLLYVNASGAAVPVTDNGGNLSIDDGGNSITVDNAVLSVVGGGTEATAQRVTIASDSTGVLSVDDNGSTLSVDDGAGSLTVDNAALSVTGGGTEATALRVTVASDSTGVLSVDDNGASLTIDNAALSVTGGGVEASALRVTIASDSTGVLSVDDNGSSLTVDGTVAVTQATASNLNAQVAGDIAHDGVDSGNPVKVGHTAIAHGSNPTAVAAADRTTSYANRHGIPFVLGGHPNIICREVLITDATGAQTDASVAGAIGAGTKVVMTMAYATADADNTVNVAVRMGFGASTLGTASATGVNGIVLSHPDLAPGSGIVIGNGAGIIGIGGDGEEVRVTCDDPAGGNVVFGFTYFTIES